MTDGWLMEFAPESNEELGMSGWDTDDLLDAYANGDLGEPLTDEEGFAIYDEEEYRQHDTREEERGER